MSTIRFLWDETKNHSNKSKHQGIGFEEAARVFSDPLRQSIQDRIENGEVRWQTLGVVQGITLLLVAHTTVEENERGETIEVIRIISARRATRRERKTYEKFSLHP